MDEESPDLGARTLFHRVISAGRMLLCPAPSAIARVCLMTFASVPNGLTFFKRYRMEVDLLDPLSPVPPLPAGFAWVGWEDRLLEEHARVKLECFRDELDGVVFPNLSCADGCLRLMRDIRHRPGFRRESTWLIAHENCYVATVQGVAEPTGVGAIQNLGVVPGYRGRGLGTALLLQALHGFRRTGLERALLEVTAQNTGAIRLYRRYGFRFRKTIYKPAETATLPLVPESAPDWCV